MANDFFNVLNRIPPRLPPEAMKTYEIRAPVSSHFRPATCEEVRCDAYLYGWKTTVATDGEAAYYIRHDRSRRHVETRERNGLASFTFEPGQQGFAGKEHDHLVPVGREEIYLVKGGDWRGNPRETPIRVHARGDDWADDFANHQDKLATRLEQG